jgi:hypothetical protein
MSYSKMKVQAVGSSEMLLTTYKATCRHSPEEHNGIFTAARHWEASPGEQVSNRQVIQLVKKCLVCMGR